MLCFLQDEAIVTDLRNAGYICDPYPLPAMSFNLDQDREWPPRKMLLGSWYDTNCPLEHGKLFLLDGKSIELLGVLIRRSEEPTT